MNTRQLGWAVAAFVLSAPVFAQTAVQSSTGIAVSSGTNVVVTPGVPASTTVVAPATTVAVLPASTISGAVLVPAGTSETVSGNTKTIVTRYWVNVPAGVERDPEFQRWMQLR